FSPYLYRARNQVERFFNKIKHYRRFATRYDKLAANYLAFIQLASIRLWLRVNTRLRGGLRRLRFRGGLRRGKALCLLVLLRTPYTRPMVLRTSRTLLTPARNHAAGS